MKLLYENTDITNDVDIISAVHRDVSGGRCDSLELTLDHAQTWYRWGPKVDDRIRLTSGGCDTGEMYLSAIAPENGTFRIYATSAKRTARRMAWESFRDKTLGDIMRICAAECGMDYRLYGVEEGFRYPYLIRENESCAAFLDRLLSREGAVLKTFGGRLTGIGIEAAQALTPCSTLYITDKQSGVTYTKRDNIRISEMTLVTPFATVSAMDKNAITENTSIVCGLPAVDAITAGRWARGLLLTGNRRAEELSVESELNASFTAMARLSVSGKTDASGEWLVDEATHDFKNERSTARLLRCVTGVM